jgi:hypothetical protein
MKRVLLFLAIVVCTISTVQADSRAVAQAKNALNDLQSAATELAREAQRDAEILRLLSDANQNLDDWQKNSALADALERVTKAEQLAGRPPFSQPRIRQAVRVAREILEPAQKSPMTADLQKLREQMNLRPISWVRDVVADETSELADLTTQVTAVCGVLAKALAGTSSAMLGRRE